jgi:DNA-binding MarR family transcriptional regulator
VDWKTYAWLNRGKRRKSVLELLSKSEKPLSAKEVKSKLKIALSQASYTLKELNEKGLINCVNPNDKIGKLYLVSKKGKELIK